MNNGCFEDNKKILLISNLPIKPFIYTYLNKFFDNNNLFVNIDSNEFLDFNLNGLDILFAVVFFDLKTFSPDFEVNVDNTNLYNNMLKYSLDLYSRIKNCVNAPIVWFGFNSYDNAMDRITGCVQRVNHTIQKINQEISDFLEDDDIYINFDSLLTQVGSDNIYDHRFNNKWNMPYSKDVMQKIAFSIYKQYCVIIGKSKKCIILDCDGVLWGGVLQEDGVEGIEISSFGKGKLYFEFQLLLNKLYNRGVLLCLSSKNDENDVINILENHSGMVLKKEVFSCIRVNWINKVDNIRYISEALNIGLDSMVFIDDDESEIQQVKNELEDVECINFVSDNVIKKLSALFNLRPMPNFQNIINRNNTIITNPRRKELKAKCRTKEEYIYSLNLQIEFRKSEVFECERLSELSQRTNKFTNGRRYTVSQIKMFLSDETYKLTSIYVKDKFSNLGLVGAIMIKNDVLDMFVLSCRAFGRNIEELMLEYCSENNVNSYIFFETSKNESVREFLSKKFMETTND